MAAWAGLSPLPSITGQGALNDRRVAIFGGWIGWWLGRHLRRERREREDTPTNSVAEMGDALDAVRDIVASLAEEMRGRAPRLQLRFLVKDGPTAVLVVRIPSLPTVDVEAIVETELENLRATWPPLASAASLPLNAPLGVAGALGPIARMDAISRRALGRFGRYLPVTKDDYERFENASSYYARELGKFVTEWTDFLAARRVALGFKAQVDNAGGAPAEDARIKLLFPDPCHQVDAPDRPKLPVTAEVRTEIESNTSGQTCGLVGAYFVVSTDHPNHHPRATIRRDHTGPSYRQGSLEVAYDYDAIPHHEPIELEPFTVGVPEPGIYRIRWTIGAKNLVHREEGELQLEVIHEAANLEPVRTLSLCSSSATHGSRRRARTARGTIGRLAVSHPTLSIEEPRCRRTITCIESIPVARCENRDTRGSVLRLRTSQPSSR